MANLRAASISNPQAWHEALEKCIVSPTGTTIALEDEVADRLGLVGAPTNSPEVQPVAIDPRPVGIVSAMPRDEWPAYIEGIALLAQPGDKGIGDVIARTVGPIGGALFKKWFEKMTGKPCGCSQRQELLNLLYPL